MTNILLNLQDETDRYRLEQAIERLEFNFILSLGDYAFAEIAGNTVFIKPEKGYNLPCYISQKPELRDQIKIDMTTSKFISFNLKGIDYMIYFYPEK